MNHLLENTFSLLPTERSQVKCVVWTPGVGIQLFKYKVSEQLPLLAYLEEQYGAGGGWAVVPITSKAVVFEGQVALAVVPKW